MTMPACPENSGAELAESLSRALRLLSRARAYAIDVDKPLWDFAVEIDRLQETGLSHCELRWLIHKGYVLAAEELESQGDREFAAPNSSTLTQRTGFVLTDAGELAAKGRPAGPLVDLRVTPEVEEVPKPEWNPVLRTLSVLQQVVKRYRVPAMNQELILEAFSEEGWPERIDDPLPPSREIDSKRRLQSAIMCLNRNQRNRLVRFRGDGSGKGILWELHGSQVRAEGA